MGGRHRRRSRAGPRIPLVALTGLLPAGLLAVANPPDAPVEAPQRDDPIRLLPAVALGPVTPDPVTVAAPPPYVELKAARQAPPPPPPPPAVPVAADTQDIPAIAAAAYQNAAAILAAEVPGCGLPWTLLAGIGRIESGHAFGALADPAGNPVTPIYGPVLDGSLAGNEVVTDTDDGVLDGSSTHDRAVGPMQFIPETWQYYASDGNGDGVTDPQNIFDAAVAAGRYLCDGGSDLTRREQRERAILRYNNSMAYVITVLAWEQTYSGGSGSV